jgi:hypothetical protein
VRPYLLWISTGPTGPVSKIIDDSRQYDVAYHDYQTDIPMSSQASEYYWRVEGEKLNVAAERIKDIALNYRAVAFLDDDLSFTPAALNAAFRVGDALGLDIWQPALTCGSYSSHEHLKQSVGRLVYPVRKVPFVEIMMPFFSRRIISEVLPTFELTLSSWGVDCYVWPTIADGYVIDSIAFGHYRPPIRRERIMANGLTPFQECWLMKKIYGPIEDASYPPGFDSCSCDSLPEI